MVQPVQSVQCVQAIIYRLLCCSIVLSGFSNASANQDQEPDLIPGTILNFMDYFRETLEDIAAQGGETTINLPQQDYSKGVGPVSVLPEIIGDVLSSPLFQPFFLFEVPTLPFELRFSIATPEVPAINRTVVGVTEQDGFTKPHIPPLRWSADGRLGVESQVGGSLANPAPVRLYLLAPEKLTKPLVESAPGPQALVLEKIELPFAKLAAGRTGTIQHTNICDPYHTQPGQRKNPYQCGPGGQDDCYDVTLVSAYVRLSNEVNGTQTPARLDDWNRLMGTPLHVRVTQPKTANAKIAEVRYGESTFSPKRTGILFETITPADGRLMIARRGFMPLVWRHTESGKTQVGSYDVVYAVAPEDANPCDVTHWSDLYPITHAPYDSRVNNRYLFAKLPFRDPSGALIPDGVDIKGTYPWMDKEAKLLSIQVSPAKLFTTYSYSKSTRSRYPVRCVSQTQCSFADISDTDNTKDNLFAIIGGWTQGKMVLLDGLVNDIDFRLGGRDRDHSYIKIYQPGSGHDPFDTGEVRIGSTRGASMAYPVRDEQGSLIGRYTPENFSMFDSIENRHNYLNHLKPSKFGDVVWTMSSGHSMDEIVFDDYTNPNAFIVSEMVAHLQHRNHDWYRMHYFDGWHQMTQSFLGQVRVQNSATTLPDQWQIPAHGRVYNGRLEPVANGGIRGKGLWFNGRNTRLQYAIDEQPRDVSTTDWFYSLFLDPRFSDDQQERMLISFPDKSHITLQGLQQINFYNSSQAQVWSVPLPSNLPSKAWSQLGVVIGAHASGNMGYPVQVFLNGYLLEHGDSDQFNRAALAGNFRPTQGNLTVGSVRGSNQAAFHGWLDDFKVYAHKPDYESICNLAHGSLIGLPANYQGAWADLAAGYPDRAHAEISRDLASYGETTFSRYACYHHYRDDDKAHKQSLPDGTVSVRESFHFPEGPLYHDAPRPDSSQNHFCLSCHTEQGIGGLSIKALTLKPDVVAKQDRRRQPTQPPAKLYGNVPTHWATGASDGGVWVDELTLPSSQGVVPLIKNLALAKADGDPWRALDQQPLDLTTLPSDITQLRINASGLVHSVSIRVNGQHLMAAQVPFTFALDFLQIGDNDIEVTGYSPQGTVTQRFQVVTVAP